MTITKEGIFVSDEEGWEDLGNRYASLCHCLMELLNKHANEVLLVSFSTTIDTNLPIM